MMDKSAIQFEVLKEDGKVVGFSLQGVGETEAESFCFSFPSAAQHKKATIAVHEGRINFKHEGYFPEGKSNPMLSSGSGEFSSELSPEDAAALGELLEFTGQYAGKKPQLSYLNAWGHGFELRVK